MSKMSIWYFLIHDELLENCYENIVMKVFKIRLILHYRASRIPELPGPLSGPWTPAARDFALVMCASRTFIIFRVYASAPPPPPTTSKKLPTPLYKTITTVLLLGTSCSNYLSISSFTLPRYTNNIATVFLSERQLQLHDTI